MKQLSAFLFFILNYGTISLAQNVGSFNNSTLAPEMFVSTNLFDKENEKIYKIDGENVKGSPFLDTGWVSGSIILKDNRTFNNQKIKYNIYSQIITCLINNQPLDITDEIKEIIFIYNDTTKKKFVNANNYKKQNNTKYLEVLVESKKGILFKKYEKVIQTDTDIAGKFRMKHFETNSTHYYYNYDKLTSIKKGGGNINEILKLTEAQKSQLAVPRVDFSNDLSILSFFALYNSLP